MRPIISEPSTASFRNRRAGLQISRVHRKWHFSLTSLPPQFFVCLRQRPFVVKGLSFHSTLSAQHSSPSPSSYPLSPCNQAPRDYSFAWRTTRPASSLPLSFPTNYNIYRISKKQVYVLSVLDSRRSVEDTLLRRLIGTKS